jgi:hypothetical protein
MQENTFLNPQANVSLSNSMEDAINECEDQLTVSMNSVIWNRGSILHKKLTFEEKVIDACFCLFDESNKSAKWLCVLLSTLRCSIFNCVGEKVQIYVPNGDSYSIPLPCQIKRLWIYNNLLLLERLNPGSSSGPILLSVLHPLEGCKPVAVVSRPDGVSLNVSTDRCELSQNI